MSARDLSYSTYLAMVISGLWIRVAYASTWKHRVLVTLSPTIFQGSGRAGDIQFSQNEAIYLGEFLCAREYINNVLHRIPLASQSLVGSSRFVVTLAVIYQAHYFIFIKTLEGQLSIGPEVSHLLTSANALVECR